MNPTQAKRPPSPPGTGGLRLDVVIVRCHLVAVQVGGVQVRARTAARLRPTLRFRCGFASVAERDAKLQFGRAFTYHDVMMNVGATRRRTSGSAGQERTTSAVNQGDERG